jgi:transcriptional regulator with XRE-family HTH domain
MMPDVKSLAEVLASRMAHRKMTDAQAAELLEVSQPTVTRWRTGRVVPSAQHAQTLAAFLDMPIKTVDKMLAGSDALDRQPMPGKGVETVGVLMRALERERGQTGVVGWKASGLEKSRYYRLRMDKAAPHLVDLPELAKALKVDEVRLVMATYRTVLAREGRAVAQTDRRDTRRAV